MKTPRPIKNDDGTSVKDVYVTSFPVSLLKRIREAAESQGVGSSNGAVVRWAASQYALSLKPEEAQR